MPVGLGSLAVVAVVAALAPVLAGFLRGWVPQVVLLLVAGILVGPEGLSWANPEQIDLFSKVGLGFLFLLAGYELDLALFRQRAGRLALAGWAVSMTLAVVIVGALYAFEIVSDYAVVAIALTTTALGTLLPILRDNAMLEGRFGRYFFAAGAVGEIAPILAIAVFLGSSGSLLEVVLLGVFALLAFVATVAPRRFAGTSIARIVMAGEHATAQTTLRITFALLLVLLFTAAEFGFDIVLGAFVAGVIVRRWSPGDVASLEGKLDSVAYGVFIPVFFVCSGMALDIDAVVDTPIKPFVILLALLLVRGAPSLLLYRRALPRVERVEMVFLTATDAPAAGGAHVDRGRVGRHVRVDRCLGRDGGCAVRPGLSARRGRPAPSGAPARRRRRVRGARERPRRARDLTRAT
jgi:Kef-type K+ transport system membrane component KefB